MGATKKHYSVNEVAEILGLARITIYGWLQAGKIKGTKLGTVWRISEAELQRIIERGV